MFKDSGTPIDTLEHQLVECERLVSRLRARQLELLRELDAAQAPLIDGARSLEDWIAARCDVSHETSRHLSRAMRHLEDRRDVAMSLAAGNVTFDRAVVTARLATNGADEKLIEFSRGCDIAGVGRLAARRRRISRRDEHEVAAGRHFAMQPNLDRSSGRVWGELPGIDFAIVEKAVTSRSDDLPKSPGLEARSARLADALVSIAQDALGPDADGTAVAADVTVFVDAKLAASTGGEAGGEIAGGSRIGPATLEELLCTGSVRVVGVREGRPISTTQSRRAIPAATRRFVLWRDQACTVDGCSSRYRLQPHHVRPFAQGGGHEAGNITTLCWYHHHVVIHRRGYRLDPASPPQRRRLLPLRAHSPPQAISSGT